MEGRLPITLVLTRLLTRGLDLLQVGRLFRYGPLLPVVDLYLVELRQAMRSSTVERREAAFERLGPLSVAIRLPLTLSFLVTIAAGAGGISLAVAGEHWAATAMFLLAGAGLATSVPGWLTNDGIGAVLAHPWLADVAWCFVVLLFGLSLGNTT